MKVQASVRKLFDEQLDLNKALIAQVNKTMTGLKDARWHYESRLKSLESFAVKIETGRVADPSKLEDFTACTLVVPNTDQIRQATTAVGKHFRIKYRRPPKPTETSKPADAFPFDDVRLYCLRRKDPALPPDPLDHIIFEVQVKTFLQHAWGIATHDFNYKTTDVTWGKDRIVAHLKAALEHVELSLQEAASLAASPSVALISPQTKLVGDVVHVMRKHWKGDDLPENLRGLAQAVASVLSAIRCTAADLDEMLSALERSSGLPANLSPYGVTLSAVLASKANELDAALSASPKPLIVITPELQLPAGFPSPAAAAKVISLS